MFIGARPGGAGAVRKIVAHVNAGPQTENGAHGLANYLRQIQGGYHEICDDHDFVICATPDRLVYGASGMNAAGYHICDIGNASSTPTTGGQQQWYDAYATGELTVTAKRFANACHMLAIPPVRLTDQQVADPNTRGICDHWQVNRAIVKPAVARGDMSMGAGDHVDVGADFPWSHFMQLVGYFYGSPPGTPSTPTSEDQMGMVVIQPGGSPAGRFKKYKLFADERAVLCSNGGRLVGDSGPTLLGCWWHFTSNGRPDGLELRPDGRGIVVTAEDDGTFNTDFA